MKPHTEMIEGPEAWTRFKTAMQSIVKVPKSALPPTPFALLAVFAALQNAHDHGFVYGLAGTGSGTAGWVEAGGRAVCFDLDYLPSPH